MSHYQFGGRKEVDSRLLVVGSQTASLTPDPSFAHNLGDRCPNGQCETIFDIYASRPFQWHQEHLNAKCFGPCCRTLNIRESRRTPTPHFFQVLGFTPTLGQSGVATITYFKCQFQNLKFQKKNNYIVPIPVDFWKSCAYGQGTLEPDLESAREHACSKELANVDQNSSSYHFKPELHPNYIWLIYCCQCN
jgi:hypothetical protein